MSHHPTCFLAGKGSIVCQPVAPLLRTPTPVFPAHVQFTVFNWISLPLVAASPAALQPLLNFSLLCDTATVTSALLYPVTIGPPDNNGVHTVTSIQPTYLTVPTCSGTNYVSASTASGDSVRFSMPGPQNAIFPSAKNSFAAVVTNTSISFVSTTVVTLINSTSLEVLMDLNYSLDPSNQNGPQLDCNAGEVQQAEKTAPYDMVSISWEAYISDNPSFMLDTYKPQRYTARTSSGTFNVDFDGVTTVTVSNA